MAQTPPSAVPLHEDVQGLHVGRASRNLKKNTFETGWKNLPKFFNSSLLCNSKLPLQCQSNFSGCCNVPTQWGKRKWCNLVLLSIIRKFIMNNRLRNAKEVCFLCIVLGKSNHIERRKRTCKERFLFQQVLGCNQLF